MKSLKELSKWELVSLITNNFGRDIGINEVCLGCVNSIEDMKARFFYVCDECDEALSEEKD